MTLGTKLRPNEALQGLRSYAVPRARAPVDLKLDGNEGCAPTSSWLDAFRFSNEDLNRYPNISSLRAKIAQRHQLREENVFLSAGADEVLDRICRVMLGPDKEMLWLEPGFEMVPKYAQMTGAKLNVVPWTTEDFPTEDCLAAIGPSTTLAVLTSPNNPTGAIVPEASVRSLVEKNPQTLFVVDEAYVEFSTRSLEECVRQYPNAMLLRTFSKAWGLAGLRVGYAISSNTEAIRWLEAIGSPFPISSLSSRIANQWLEDGEASVGEYVRAVQYERTELYTSLKKNGMVPLRSEGNFVFARHPIGEAGALWVRDALAGLGISIRAFPGRASCRDAVRITCPGESNAFERLVSGLNSALAPAAMLFDLDGVLADVGASYRNAIARTAAHFGADVDDAKIENEKRLGQANDDWDLTRRLLQKEGIVVSIEEVTEVFENHYQGFGATPGLKNNERLTVEPAVIRGLACRFPLAIVTGRPRADAEWFLSKTEIRDCFQVVICREDAALKPSAEPVLRALEELGVRTAWMVGDTPDDVVAARRAGVVPLGVLPPKTESPDAWMDALYRSGAARVFADVREFFALGQGMVR